MSSTDVTPKTSFKQDFGPHLTADFRLGDCGQFPRVRKEETVETSRVPPLRTLFEHLRARVPLGVWWPADSDFEILVGAILTQNTTWKNVEYSLRALKEQQLLSPTALCDVEESLLIKTIQPSGFMNAKARYIRNASEWFIKHNDNAAQWSTHDLRESLLTVRGIGPETADDILLYIYRRPVFIWDLYARRLLDAAGYDVPPSYESARRALTHHVDEAAFSIDEFAIFHGLIVDGGKIARKHKGWNALLPVL